MSWYYRSPQLMREEPRPCVIVEDRILEIEFALASYPRISLLETTALKEELNELRRLQNVEIP